MFKKAQLALAAAGLLAFTGVATAQTYYITGTLTDPEYAPGSGVFFGSGATVADTEISVTEGVLNQKQVSAALLNITPGVEVRWEIAREGFADPTEPGTKRNAWFFAPTPAAPVTFFYQRNAPGDGFIPENNFTYTSADAATITAADGVVVVGDFVSELGGADWTPEDPFNPVLSDAGSGTVGDGVWGVEITNLPPGAYGGLILINPNDPGAFDRKISFGGLGNGDDLAFTVFDNSDTITILLQVETGRVRIESDSPLANPGPPFFAYSDVTPWGTSAGPNTELTDNGDGTHSRVFTVPTPGEYYLKIRQGVGPSVPNSGNQGYPFTTTASNQEILVVYDTNTYTDGYIPASNFVVVVDDATRDELNTFEKIQPVGDWQTAFGAPGNFDNNFAGHFLSNEGDGIWAGTFTQTVDPQQSGTGVIWKAVGRRDGNTEDAASNWNLQIGGDVEGLNAGAANNPNGTNLVYEAGQPLSFKVDTITGRIRSDVGTSVPDPVRGPYLPGFTSVDEWMMY